jgi:hypothetical protein
MSTLTHATLDQESIDVWVNGRAGLTDEFPAECEHLSDDLVGRNAEGDDGIVSVGRMELVVYADPFRVLAIARWPAQGRCRPS